MTSVEIIAPYSTGACPRPVCGCCGNRAVCRRQSRVWSELAGTEEEAAVWTGWAAFSSRAFQNLPGASLKQKEEAAEEEEGLPVGMQETEHYSRGTAIFNVHRGSTVISLKILMLSVLSSLTSVDEY